MANLTPASNNTVTLANAGTFIPELWSDEIIAAYKQNLVLANLVNKMPMTGKKGDTLHIPKPTRGAANAKTAADTVTIQQTANTEVQVVIDNHYEYSRLIEDIAEVQALDSLRRFYTDDAGYALAKQVDDDLFAELLNVSNDAGTADGSDATQSHYQINGASDALIDYDDSTALEAFSDAAFRNMIQALDDADVPMDNRVLIIPPSIRNAIMGIERYVSSDFVNGRGVNNGQIGQLYGVDVYVTSNAPTVTGTNTSGRVATIMHKDAFVLAEQMAVRSQTQYKQEFLANLFTADTLYGTKVLREENVLSVVV
jgi:N4-gp56 family major capsid protein